MCKDVPWAYNQRQDGSPASPPGNSVTFCALLPGAALCALPGLRAGSPDRRAASPPG
ncbi:hypothetical protein CSC17_4689 [Klebsiella oxytoca]|nr:hypothetical protein CSC17_4689 [Klebsiella oxytoca]